MSAQTRHSGFSRWNIGCERSRAHERLPTHTVWGLNGLTKCIREDIINLRAEWCNLLSASQPVVTRQWSADDEAALQYLVQANATNAEIARLLRLTEEQVEMIRFADAL